MGVFREATSDATFFKAGFYGGTGAGKTFTASLVAIGLWKYIKTKKPVFFGDSEAGSDYVSPIFKREGVPLRIAKSRSFADLLEMFEEAIENASIFIYDSISHPWDELVDGYKERKKITRMFVQHWMELKPVWRQGYADKFIMAPIHAIICGRAGDIWEDVETEEDVWEMKKTGTKMRVEKELGYEPSLLVEMVKTRTKHTEGSGWIHRAFVEKDRFGVIDSQFFDEPTFESFLPHIELLNIGGEHKPVQRGTSSAEIFKNKNNGYQRMQRKKIALEKIKEENYIAYPGQSADDKKGRSDLLKEMFGTRSWTEVENMDVEILEERAKALELYNSPEMKALKEKMIEESKEEITKPESKSKPKSKPKSPSTKKKTEVKK
jgi:hypothetical protein